VNIEKQERETNANYQQVLWHFDSDVLRRSCTAHFHALYSEFEALIDIRTFEVIRGELPGPAMALVLEWAQLHREELMREWELCVQNQTPMKIRPLA
jgi:hypothetical protein